MLHRPLVLVFAISAALNIALWLLAWQFYSRHPEAAVLHYNIDVGVDLIGEGQQITMLPTAGTVLLAVNGLLGILVRRVDTRAAWVVWGVTPIVQLILVGTVILLWRINA